MLAESAAALEYVAHASHDIRQPLASVVVYAELLINERDPQRCAMLRARMQIAVTSLQSLCDDMIETYRQVGDSADQGCEPIALNELLARLGDELQLLAMRKGLELVIPCVHAHTRSAPHLLERVLRNLITNAIHHTEQGTVAVTVHAIDQMRWQINVADCGIGLPHAVATRLASGVLGYGERRDGAVHGLGLAVVKRLCDVLEHPLTVKPRPEGGTVFSIEVPRWLKRVGRKRAR